MHHLLIVVVDVAGASYGLPIAVVQDTIRLSAARRGQNSPRSGFPAAVEYGGRQIPVMNLRCHLRQGRGPVKRTRTLVVVESGGDVAGLLVDAVVDIREVPGTMIQSVAPAEAPHPAVCQVARLECSSLDLLDPERLLSSRRQASCGRDRRGE